MYLYQNTAYPTQPALLSALNLGAGAPLPEGVEKLKPVIPEIQDEKWQYLDFDGGTLDAANKTYELAVKNVRQYALVIDGVVERLSFNVPNQNIVDSDTENAGRVIEWVPVPFEINKHIAVGWSWDVDHGFIITEEYINSYQSQTEQNIIEQAGYYQNQLTGTADPEQLERYRANVDTAEKILKGEPLNPLISGAFNAMFEADKRKDPEFFGAMDLRKFATYLSIMGVNSIAGGLKIEAFVVDSIAATRAAETVESKDSALAAAAEEAKAEFEAMQVAAGVSLYVAGVAKQSVIDSLTALATGQGITLEQLVTAVSSGG